MSNKKPVLLKFYDYKHMGDYVNLKEAINDLYDY